MMEVEQVKKSRVYKSHRQEGKMSMRDFLGIVSAISKDSKEEKIL
jgi:hypothetical protein